MAFPLGKLPESPEVPLEKGNAVSLGFIGQNVPLPVFEKGNAGPDVSQEQVYRCAQCDEWRPVGSATCPHCGLP